MNIDELTFGQIKEIKNMFGGNCKSSKDTNCVWEVGKQYAIRTVTMIQTGRLKRVTEHELLLSDAAWIADTGRWNAFLKGDIEASEVEPFVEDAIIGRGALIDATKINFKLPRKVK